MRLRFFLLIAVSFLSMALLRSGNLTVDFLALGEPQSANATPTLSGAKPVDILNGDFSGVGLGQVGAADNSDIEASSSTVGTPPTNNGFSTGDFTGWTYSSNPSIQSSGGNYYAQLGSSDAVRSAAFTVDSLADQFSVQISTSGGYNFYISIFYGASYGSVRNNSFVCASSCTSGWRTFTVDAAEFRGQSVKIEVKRFGGTILVDDAGIQKNLIPGWAPSDGSVYQLKSGGPTGKYAELGGGLENVISNPIAVHADAQNISFDIQVVSGIVSVYILSGSGYSTSSQIAAYTTSNASSWGTKTFGIGDFAGENIKLKFTTATSTTFRFDNAGLLQHVVPGVTVEGRGEVLHGSAKADNVYIHAAIEYPGAWFRVCGSFLASYNGAGINVGTQLFVWYDGVERTALYGYGGAGGPEKQEGIFYVGVYADTASSFRVWLTSAGGPERPSLDCLERIDPPSGAGGGHARSPVGANLDELIAKPTTAASPDPVDLITGNFVHGHVDIAVPGKGVPLTFARTYSAQSLTDPLIGSPLGAKWSHNWMSSLYETDNDDVLIRAPGGGKYFFDKVSSNYVPVAGVEATLVKNGGGDWTLTTNGQLQYNFSSAGKLTSIVDRNGYTTSLTYDGSGRLTTITEPGARTLTLAYNGNDQISSVTDSLSRVVSFTYSNGDLATVTDVNGGVTTYEYSWHLLTKGTDSNDHDFVRNTYDGNARVVSQLDALSNETVFEYSTPGDGATTMIDARGKETVYYFDQKYRITDIVNDDGNTTSFTWDGDNNQTCVTDPLGYKVGMTYDAKGNLTGLIDQDNTNSGCTLKTAGVQWTFAYTATNDIDLATDPMGRSTDYVYDGSGNLTEVLRKDGSSVTKLRTCFTVPGSGGNKGLVMEIIESTALSNCTGNTTTLDYDSYGNVTSAIDPRFAGQVTPPVASMTYDLGGRLLTVTNEVNHTTTLTYDNKNNLLTSEDQLGNTTTRTLDDKGLLGAVEDANLNETAYVYDAADRLIQVTDAEDGVTVYGYDEVGNRTSVTDANRATVAAPETGADCGAAGTGDGTDDDSDSVIDDGCPSVIYTYDDLNRLSYQTDALGNVWSYTYDAAGRLTTRTDAKSQVVTYGYDSRGNLTSIDYPSGTPDVTLSYNALSMRTQMTDGTGTTTYGYDSMNRPTSITFPGSRSVGYGYDNVGNRTSVTYPGGSDVVTYAYDEAGNLETVTDWNSNQTTYAYDDAGMLYSTTLPNGIVSSYTYDNADRLTSISHMLGMSTVKAVSYTLDDVGNRTQRMDGLGTHTYAYDDLYRLTSVTYPGPATDTYTYDAVGNRISKNATAYSYDAADRLVTVGATNYSFDDNGNQTARGSDSYSWDAADRLTSATVSSLTTTFAYNGDGLRDSLTVSSNTTTFTWDVALSIPQVLDDGTMRYVYGLGRISQVESDETTHYFLADALGSTMALTDDVGVVENSYEYDVFGEVRATSGSEANVFGFAGEQGDESTDLEYLRARYYDASSGSFLSRDPLDEVASWSGHAYAYADASPTRWSDPSGLDPEDEWLGPLSEPGPFDEFCARERDRCQAYMERMRIWDGSQHHFWPRFHDCKQNGFYDHQSYESQFPYPWPPGQFFPEEPQAPPKRPSQNNPFDFIPNFPGIRPPRTGDGGIGAAPVIPGKEGNNTGCSL